MQDIHVLFLCLGNICRSPLAEGVFRHNNYRSADYRFVADSAGTSSWHVGKAPHHGSIDIAEAHGIDLRELQAQQLQRHHFEEFDFIVAMDASNMLNAQQVGTMSPDRLVRLRDFDPAPGDGDVPDPYGGGSGGFSHVYEIMDRSLPGLVEHMQELGPKTTD